VGGSLPHAEALRKMQEMDLLLILLAGREKVQEIVTGKLFEYILAERPILVLGDEGLEVRKIVLENGLGYFLNLFDPSLDEGLRELYRLWQQGCLVRYDRDDFGHFRRDEQYKKLTALLG